MRLAPLPVRSGGRRRFLPRDVRAGLFVRLFSLIAVIALGLTIGILFGMPGGSRGGASASRPALPTSDAPLVVYSEFAANADALWAADPDHPERRTQLALVPHAANYGIVASLSPDGRRVAYTVLPPSVADPANDTPAQLWVLDFATGDALLAAEGIDLPMTPVWTPDGSAMVVRRSTWSDSAGGHFELVRVALDGATTTLVTSAAGLLPVGFSPDGGILYFTSISDSGSDLGRVAGDGAVEQVVHLSDGYARDWQLSPDGTKLAYLAQASDAGIAFEAQVLDIGSGATEAAIAGAPVEQFSPVWDANGALTVGRLAGAAARIEGGATTSLPKTDGGFDAPLSWSPDGSHLALRAFAGTSIAEPGPSRVVVLAADGTRRQLSENSDVTVLGWLEAAP
jgi:Tol biopolymer transport system component